MINSKVEKTPGRVGIVVPAGGEYVIDDFRRWMSSDIEISFYEVLLSSISPEGLKKLGDDAVKAMEEFSGENAVDLALFGCTSGSLIGGPGYDARLCRTIKENTEIPEVYTTTTSILAALRALEARKITICTPYPDDINEKEKAVFEAEGFVVNNICSIETPDPRNPQLVGKISSRDVFDFAVENMHPESDTMFISCAGMLVLDIIEELEQKLGVPVVTSNQCAAWMMGDFFGRHGKDAGRLGKLFNLSCRQEK